MMTEEYAASRYEEACALLPGRLRALAMTLPLERKAAAEEAARQLAEEAQAAAQTEKGAS